jgi:hemoglobin
MNNLTKKHIEKLVIHFYQRVQEDELLAPVFNDAAQVNWEHHIPLLCQFWNSIMLKTNEYHGGAYMKHVLIGQKENIQKTHFTRWLSLFQEEATKHLPSDAAKEIVHKASLIAQSLQYGMLNNHNH